MRRGIARVVPVVLIGTVTWGGVAPLAWADTVILKNGRRVDGKLVVDNDREVVIKTRAGVLVTFERRTVASIERDAQAPTGVKPPVDEDLVVPPGASEDDVQRLRALVPQLREAARRWIESKKEREAAEKEGPAGADRARLAAGREKEFLRQLEQMKAAREAIDRSAATRLAAAQRAAKAEADGLRADTDRLRAANDAAGLADRALKLRARTPEDPKDPRHDAFVAEAVYAMTASAEVDARLAQSAKTVESRVAGFVRAAEHHLWCALNGPSRDAASARGRAVEAYGQAHRAAGFRALVPGAKDDVGAIEKALQSLHAFRACAALVEDRLGERRWGPDVQESEAGQYRLTLDDGRVVYAPDLPSSGYARAVQERRERNEQRTQKEGSGSRTVLVKATRWYELAWDAPKKRWTRETQLTQLEGQKLVPLLRSTQELADAVARAQAELARVDDQIAAKREGAAQVRKRVEQADGTQDQLEEALKEVTALGKTRDAAVAHLGKAQTALDARVKEIAELDRELDRVKRGD